MIKKIDNKTMGRSNLGWLQSIFHFSFADYRDRSRMGFGVLRVINDDLIASNTGFEMHPHQDMEIISYVVNGHLTHGDSMGNKNTIGRGNVQYMSAGTGIYHSEHNLGAEEARLLQIWIKPSEKRLAPKYGDHSFDWELRQNKWLNIVSSVDGNAAIKINQDANICVSEIDKEKMLTLDIKKGRIAYLVLIEGEVTINHESLVARDALEIIEGSIEIKANEKAHVLVVEMRM
jgi:redox-sensitive bicupin YhaK (pirin superfamily)